nr:type IV pilus modification protein PilV [Ramlibacter ginsenosidimutans]
MRAARRQAGFSMLEVMVALLLVAMALLGQARLLAGSVRLAKGADNRMQAVLLSAELGERMENNRDAARSGAYVQAAGSTPATMQVDCNSFPCTATELASFDLAVWEARAAAVLPGATWELDQDATDTSRYTIILTWQERVTQADRITYATSGTTETLSLTTIKELAQ